VQVADPDRARALAEQLAPDVADALLTRAVVAAVEHPTGVQALARRPVEDRSVLHGRTAPLLLLDAPRHPGNAGAAVRVAAAAREAGWTAALFEDWVIEGSAASRTLNSSVWIAMSRDPAKLGRLLVGDTGDGAWRPLSVRRDFPGWSDDYGSILPLLRTRERRAQPAP